MKSRQYASTGDGDESGNGVDDDEGAACNNGIQDGSGDEEGDDNGVEDESDDVAVPTFWALLCAREPDFDEDSHSSNNEVAPANSLVMLKTAINPLAYSGNDDDFSPEDSPGVEAHCSPNATTTSNNNSGEGVPQMTAHNSPTADCPGIQRTAHRHDRRMSGERVGDSFL